MSLEEQYTWNLDSTTSLIIVHIAFSLRNLLLKLTIFSICATLNIYTPS